MVEERRESCRVPFGGRAYLTYAGRCRSEAVVDISKNGVLLSSGARLKPGREVKVFLPLPSRRGWRLCLLKGEVAPSGSSSAPMRSTPARSSPTTSREPARFYRTRSPNMP
jgi:hypothetical protein